MATEDEIQREFEVLPRSWMSERGGSGRVIGSVRTKTGLVVKAKLDTREYPFGVEVSTAIHFTATGTTAFRRQCPVSLDQAFSDRSLPAWAEPNHLRR